MQITIGSVALTGSVPAEDAQDLRIVPGASVQEVPGLGAASVTYIPRQNQKNVVTFRVQRQHDDGEAAAFFIASLDDTFPVAGVFILATQDGTRSIPGAVAQITESSVTGATSTVGYRVSGGAFVQQIPTTTS